MAIPIPDRSRIPAALFHDFHRSWSIRIEDARNAGRRSDRAEALVERRDGPRESDVLAIEVRPGRRPEEAPDGGAATLPPPNTRIMCRTDKAIHASRADRIIVAHRLGRIIAVIEIVQPGSKDSRAALRDVVPLHRDPPRPTSFPLRKEPRDPAPVSEPSERPS